MRILVTKQGNIIIQEIDDSVPILSQVHNFHTNSNSNININSSGNKFRGYSTNYSMLRNSKFAKQPFMKSRNFSRTNHLFPDFYGSSSNFSGFSNTTNMKFHNKKNYKKKNLEDLEITKEDILSAKQIKLNEHKITFPKQFAEKYENDILNNGIINSNNNILPSLTSKKIETMENNKNTLNSKSNNNYFEGTNSSLIRKEKYLSLGEIIPNNSLKEMKKKIIKDRRLKDREKVITENDFRSSYDPQTDIQKFNDILAFSRLNSNKSSLIKYLNEKKLDPLTIKILSRQDSDKISKINKMCQTIFQNQDKEKLFNDIVKNKAKQRINTTKKEFQITINDLGADIVTLQEKLKKYDKKIDQKEKYREHFNDMVVNHWLKKDLERFNKKSTPKPSYLKSFFDGEEVDNSTRK